MKRLTNREKRLATCVGLWLAEGDNKSKSEITFTNSRLELIDLFYTTINEFFKDYKYNARIYFYSNDKRDIILPYKNCKIKCYLDKRTKENYLIFRLASVKLMEKWRGLVKEILSSKELYPHVLRGFFAGEGNIKEVSHNSRVLRISQKEQKEFIDKILRELNIKYTYAKKELSYNISGKKNWDIFAKLKLANLHPAKKDKFWKVYQNFKEEHYDKNFLANNFLELLDKPLTMKQLSAIFKRTPSRIQDVLIELKKKGKLNNFRVRSVDYWTTNLNLIIISKLKNEYLLLLDKPKQTSEFAKYFKVDWKSAFKRLNELQNLNLARRQNDRKWIRLQTEKKVVAI